jgi:transposase
MATDTQVQFSLAEKEEILTEARERYAKAKHAVRVMDDTIRELEDERLKLLEVSFDLGREYHRLDQALIEQLSS